MDIPTAKVRQDFALSAIILSCGLFLLSNGKKAWCEEKVRNQMQNRVGVQVTPANDPCEDRFDCQ